MIEETVLEYLQEALNIEEVFLEIPRQIPSQFIVLRITDRGRENLINEVTVEIMSYAESKYSAALLDENVRAAMDQIQSLTNISCRFGGGNDTQDTTIKKARYRCYYNLYY